MNIKIPRDVWSLPEIHKRWKIEPLDLYRAIMAGILKPCVMLDYDLMPVAIVDGVATILPDVEPERVRRYVYPAFVQQTEPFNFRCEYVCDMAATVEGCKIWRLPQPVTLLQLMEIAVCMREDVEEAEAALMPVRDDDTLTTKEKNSLARLLVTMYVETYGWNPDDERAEGLTSLVRSAEGLGLPVSYNTARKHLSDCWARATPKEDGR